MQFNNGYPCALIFLAQGVAREVAGSSTRIAVRGMAARARSLVATLMLVVTADPVAALTLQCEQELAEVSPVVLSADKTLRMKLDEATRCRWHPTDTEATPSLLFSFPMTNGPIEIEIASRLDAAGTTATHVVMMNADYQPVRWIPHTSFRERKKQVRTRFFVNPADNIRYILVGGASNSTDDSLSRIYAPTSTNLLNFAGLVTARELEAEFLFVPTGEISIQIIKSKYRKIRIDRVATENVASGRIN